MIAFAIKNNSTNNSIELEKGQIHSGITLTVFTISESPKFHQIKKKQISYRKKGKIGWHRGSTAYFFRNTEKRYPYVTTAAAQQQQQQHSRSSGGGGSTASLFLHSCRSSTVVHQKERRGHIKNMVDKSSRRLMSNSILVHMFWPPLLLNLLLLLLLYRYSLLRAFQKTQNNGLL